MNVRGYRGVVWAIALATTVLVVILTVGAAKGSSDGTAQPSATVTISMSASSSPAPTSRRPAHQRSNAHEAPNVYAAIASRTLAPAVRHDPPYVYVPNGVPGTVEVIDPSTFTVVRRISFGAGSYPEHVTPSWNMRWLYVDVDGLSALGVIDPRTGRLVRMIHGVDRPYNLYFTPDGSRAIDVAEYENALDFMDPHRWTLTRRVTMPCRGSDHLDFGPPGTHYLLISCEYDGRVIKVDWRHMRVLDVMEVGGLPVDVKLTPDGKRFLVANQGLGGVSVVDPGRMKVVGFIKTAQGAHGMAIARNTRLVYVTNRLAGSISVIDLSRLRVVATWNVGGSPDMAQVSRDGRQLWVSNRYGTTVSVISTADGRVLHRIEVGQDPHGLTYFPQPGRVSLGHNGVYR
jgi:YVTN family beta-propeller protein